MSELIAALDIGTSKIVALVAEIDAENNINVIGFGEQPSIGLRKGMVVDIDVVFSINLRDQSDDLRGADIESGDQFTHD